MKNRLNWVELPTQKQLEQVMYNTFTFNIYAKSFVPPRPKVKRVVLVSREY